MRARAALRRPHNSDTFSGNGGTNLLTNKLGISAVGLGVLGLLAVAACGSTTAAHDRHPGQSSQVLHFPVFQDPGTWDPGEMDAEVDSELMQNVFDNLWRFDDNLNIVPDIASAVPTAANGGISADGLDLHDSPESGGQVLQR